MKYLYSSTPDLNNSIFKKSKFSNCKYIYLQHSLASISHVYNNNAFDSFDAVQSVTSYQFEEYNELKKKKNLKYKNFKSNYFFIKRKIQNKDNKKFQVLIAPTWNTDFYKQDLHNKLNILFKSKNISFYFAYQDL